MRIIKDKKIIKCINEFIEEKRNCLNENQEIIGETIFEVISKENVVLLYYYIDDDIEGCHMYKPLANGEIKQFIFINTKMLIQEQVWTAGHELGHVWEIDQIIKEKVGCCEYNNEELIGRFVAELLIPEEVLKKHIELKIIEMEIEPTKVSNYEMLELIAYSMNVFCTPFKSIVKRFIEVGYLSEDSYEKLLAYEKTGILDEIIKENQYSRINKENIKKIIENLPRDLEEIEDKELMNKNKIKKIRNLFDIERRYDKENDYFGLRKVD